MAPDAAHGRQMTNMAPMMVDMDPNIALIEIAGQSICSSGPVTIERTFPTGLNGRISTGGWNQFCQEIDRGLEPYTGIRNTCRIGHILTIVVAVVFCVSQLYLNSDYMQETSKLMIVLPFGIALVLYAPIHLWKRNTLKKFRVVEKDLKEVCTRKSNETSQISYSIIKLGGGTLGLLYGKLSVSVKVTDGNNNGNNNGTELYAGMNLVSTELTNNPQRLQELEGIRSSLIQEEYDDKRQDILDSM